METQFYLQDTSCLYDRVRSWIFQCTHFLSEMSPIYIEWIESFHNNHGPKWIYLNLSSSITCTHCISFPQALLCSSPSLAIPHVYEIDEEMLVGSMERYPLLIRFHFTTCFWLVLNMHGADLPVTEQTTCPIVSSTSWLRPLINCWSPTMVTGIYSLAHSSCFC